MIVNDDTDTVPPDVIVPDRFRSPEPLPQLMSTTRTPADVTSDANVCVPVAGADASDVIALAVHTPPEGAAAAVADSGSSASRVLPESAVATDAGWVPL